MLGEALSEREVGKQIVDVARTSQGQDDISRTEDPSDGEDSEVTRGPADECALPHARPRRKSEAASTRSLKTSSVRLSDGLPFNLSKLLRHDPMPEQDLRILIHVQEESVIHSSRSSPNRLKASPTAYRNSYPAAVTRNSYPVANSPITPLSTVSPTRDWSARRHSSGFSFQDEDDFDEDAAEKAVRRRQLAKVSCMTVDCDSKVLTVTGY